MAIDPATAKVLITLVKQFLTDKNTRQMVFTVIAIPIALILLIVSSPFAILFGSVGETAGDPGESVPDIMAGLHGAMQVRMQAECTNDGTFDEVTVVYMGGEGATIDNTGQVLALYAVEHNMANDPELARQVINLTTEQAEELKALYWRMNTISTKLVMAEETPTPAPVSSPIPALTPAPAPPPGSTENPAPTDTARSHMTKYVYVTCLSYEDMLPEYDFSEQQLSILNEMMTEYYTLFSGMGGNTITLSPERIAEIRAGLPEGLEQLREFIVLAAYSLVGNVKYFWGGTSKSIGWDDEWGKMRMVTNEGSPTTGTLRPYGLDCSGFAAWVFVNGFYNAGLSEQDARNLVIHNLGSGTWDTVGSQPAYYRI